MSVMTLLFLALLGFRVTNACAEKDVRTRVEQAMHDLADPAPAKRVAAARVLRGAFPEGACAVPLLEVALQDEKDPVREAAREAIVALANEGAKVLVEFLEDTSHPENRAFCDALALIRARGACVTPWGLDEIEGRDARAVRSCLTPPEANPEIERRMRFLLRELIASDAGTFARIGKGLLPLPERRIACAALAVNGLASLPSHSTRSVPKGAVRLASHADDRLRWAGVRLLEVLRADSKEARDAVERARTSVRRAPTRAPEEQTIEELLASLPDPSGVVSAFEIFCAEHTIRALAARGPSANAAVPKLEALFERMKDPAARAAGEEFALLAALCRIAGPNEARLAILLDGLEGAESLTGLDARTAVRAAVALSVCVDRTSSTATRQKVAERAAEALVSSEINLREALLSVLEQLGQDAGPAAPALAATIPWTEGRLAGHFEKAREKAAKPNAVVDRHGAFLADTWDFAGTLAVRHRAALLLARIGSLPKSVRQTLEPYAQADDPLLRCEVAASLRRAAE